MVYNFWKSPWGYAPSFVIHGSFFFVGLLLTFFTDGQTISMPAYPENIYLLLVVLALSIVLHFSKKIFEFAKWLTSYQCIIAEISFFFLNCLLIGVIPQGPAEHSFLESFALNNVLGSFYFAFSIIFIMISLLLVSFKRILQFKGAKNIAFIFNHVGLLLIFFAVTFGAGDIKTYNIETHQNELVYIGQEKHQMHPRQLPFAIKLKKFNLEEYLPYITIVDSKENLIKRKNENKLIEATLGNHTLLNYEINVLDFFQDAAFIGDKYVSHNDLGSVPAANVVVLDKKTGAKFNGWIAPESQRFPLKILELSNGEALAMLSPRPKKFESIFNFYKETGEEFDDISIEVNKPFKIGPFYNAWYFYQTGYDNEMGKWSRTSTIQAVNDPWLVIVYLGLIMTALGSLALLSYMRRGKA